MVRFSFKKKKDQCNATVGAKKFTEETLQRCISITDTTKGNYSKLAVSECETRNTSY